MEKYSKTFDSMKKALEYQNEIIKSDEVKSAVVKRLLNIHTNEWVYGVVVEYK